MKNSQSSWRFNSSKSKRSGHKLPGGLVLHYVLQESDYADRSHVVATKHRDSRFRLTLAEAMLPMMMMIRIRMDFVGRLYWARPFRVQV